MHSLYGCTLGSAVGFLSREAGEIWQAVAGNAVLVVRSIASTTSDAAAHHHTHSHQH